MVGGLGQTSLAQLLQSKQ